MAYADVIIAAGPVAYWRLGEPSGTTANDEIGTLDGTYVDTPTLGATGALSGDSDTAVTLNGTSEYITVPDNAVIDLGNGPWSLEAWVKRSGNYATNYAYVISKGTQWALSFDTDDKVLLDNDGSASCRSSVAITDSTWHHLVATHDVLADPPHHLYVDGSDVTTEVNANNFSANGDTMRIGDYIAGGNLFAGTIDEVAIYDYELTLAQVDTHYAAATASVPTWVSPADAVGISALPVLVFTSPVSGSAQHFNLQLDTANTFNTGNLRDLTTNTSQTGWEYWNGSTWTAFPAGGLASGYSGNDVRHTVQSALSTTTWYRRVRAGT